MTEATCWSVSADCRIAANTSPRPMDRRVFQRAQEAADFARAWVAGFDEPGWLPRAEVWRLFARNGTMLLIIWRLPDGTTREQRHDGRKAIEAAERGE